MPRNGAAKPRPPPVRPAPRSEHVIYSTVRHVEYALSEHEIDVLSARDEGLAKSLFLVFLPGFFGSSWSALQELTSERPRELIVIVALGAAFGSFWLALVLGLYWQRFRSERIALRRGLRTGRRRLTVFGRVAVTADPESHKRAQCSPDRPAGARATPERPEPRERRGENRPWNEGAEPVSVG